MDDINATRLPIATEFVIRVELHIGSHSYVVKRGATGWTVTRYGMLIEVGETLSAAVQLLKDRISRANRESIDDYYDRCEAKGADCGD